MRAIDEAPELFLSTSSSESENGTLKPLQAKAMILGHCDSIRCPVQKVIVNILGQKIRY